MRLWSALWHWHRPALSLGAVKLSVISLRERGSLEGINNYCHVFLHTTAEKEGTSLLRMSKHPRITITDLYSFMCTSFQSHSTTFLIEGHRSDFKFSNFFLLRLSAFKIIHCFLHGPSTTFFLAENIRHGRYDPKTAFFFVYQFSKSYMPFIGVYEASSFLPWVQHK